MTESELRTGSEPADASARQRDLLRTPRWAWLATFIDTWYSDPVTAQDASATEEIDAAETALGVDLPQALREWFELVGRRLEWVQDLPARPSDLRLHGGLLVPWTENQGCWRLLITGSGPDPECAFDDPTERETWGRGPLTAFLRTMSVSDTLVGAWIGGRGPLGELGHQVRGGFDMEITAERAAGIRAAYAALPPPTGPYWGEGFPKGDARTVIRGDETSGMGLEWMTATDAAYERFCEVADIDPERARARRDDP